MVCRSHPRELDDQELALKIMQSGELQNDTWIPYPKNDDRTMFWMQLAIFERFLYFKEHRVLFDIFKEFTTKLSLRYKTIEIQYSYFTVFLFFFFLGLGSTSSFLDLKTK